MALKDKHQLLAGLKKNKRNRSIEEAQEVLAAFGFEYRAASKEQGGVWRRGMYTITLPFPHGSRDKALAPKYIGWVIRVIELAEADDEENQDDN